MGRIGTWHLRIDEISKSHASKRVSAGVLRSHRVTMAAVKPVVGFLRASDMRCGLRLKLPIFKPLTSSVGLSIRSDEQKRTKHKATSQLADSKGQVPEKGVFGVFLHCLALLYPVTILTTNHYNSIRSFIGPQISTSHCLSQTGSSLCNHRLEMSTFGSPGQLPTTKPTP